MVKPGAAANPGAEAAQLQAVADQLARTASRPWTLMEVCGGQTHAILRWGLDQLLPADLQLIHGPGCPVCVTPTETLDLAQQLAMHPGVILGSYGDMLRVPGSSGGDLLGVRAAGGDVRVLTSPLQALALARQHPHRQVVFLAVGFEPLDILTGVLRCVEQLEAGEAELQNAYGRVVRREGNAAARALIQEVFEVVDLPWRGLGLLEAGGLALRDPYRQLDARQRFSGSPPQPGSAPDSLTATTAVPSLAGACMAGLVLQGRLGPADCPSFGSLCTPEHPLGAPMVSSEGACAAYHRYRRR